MVRSRETSYSICHANNASTQVETEPKGEVVEFSAPPIFSVKAELDASIFFA
jgi:hypothetical protein